MEITNLSNNAILKKNDLVTSAIVLLNGKLNEIQNIKIDGYNEENK